MKITPLLRLFPLCEYQLHFQRSINGSNLEDELGLVYRFDTQNNLAVKTIIQEIKKIYKN